MQVTSFSFLFFVLIIAALCYCLPRKFRYILLLLSSIGFYVSLDVIGCAVLLVSILTTYVAGLMLDKNISRLDAEGSDNADHKSNTGGSNNIIFAGCIILNIAILAAFKYLGFFLGSEDSAISIVAPIGISFYILKAASYLIDVKRGTIRAEKNIAKYAIYVSFFTHASIARANHNFLLLRLLGHWWRWIVFSSGL